MEGNFFSAAATPTPKPKITEQGDILVPWEDPGALGALGARPDQGTARRDAIHRHPQKGAQGQSTQNHITGVKNIHRAILREVIEMTKNFIGD